MAVDTRDKRASVLGVNRSSPRLEQNPSGTIAQAGRQIAGLVYSGILAAAPATQNLVRRTMFGEAGTRRMPPRAAW